MSPFFNHPLLAIGAALLFLSSMIVAQEPSPSQEAPASQDTPSAQDAAAPQGKAQADYCAKAVGPIAHGDVLTGFCIWVLSFDKRLPDIIGNQETRRFSTEDGKDQKLIDTTSARIAYISGRSRFSDVAINHVKIAQTDDSTELLKLHGAWSYGDYGDDVRMLFRLHADTQFSFVSESTWHDIPVFIFGYQVRENHWWQMRAREKIGAPLQTALPPYQGRILIDKKTLSLVRFERQTTDIEKHFPLRFGSKEMDYKLLPLGDGTSFVLPVEGRVMFCHDDKRHRCDINETSFANWQKFAAKTRILMDATEPQ